MWRFEKLCAQVRLAEEIARLYEVSYPTVRLRLDKLIQKIELADQKEDEPFSTFIKGWRWIPASTWKRKTHHRQVQAGEKGAVNES